MRARLIVFLAAIGGFLPLVTDGFLPAVRPMMAELHTDVPGAQLTISLVLAGFACAQLIVGTAADRFGRRPVLIVATCLFAFASIGVAASPSLGLVLAFRFLQGVSAAAGPVLMRAVVRDLCSRAEGARVLSLLGIGFAVVPLVVPAVNARVVVTFGWRAALIIYVLYLAATLAMAIGWFRETLAAPDPLALSPGDLLRVMGSTLRHPQALGYMLCCMFGYAGLAVWISSAPHLVSGYFGQPPERFGIYWAIPVATYVAGAYVSARALRTCASETLLKAGVVALMAAGIALLLLAYRPVALNAFVAAVGLYNFGWAIVQPQAQIGALSFFPRQAGRVSAVLGFLQMLGGATIGLLFAYLHDGTPQAAALLIAASALATMVATVVLTARRPALST